MGVGKGDIMDENQKEIFQVGIDLAEKIIAKTQEISGSVDEVRYKHIMQYFFSKSYKTFQAVQLLCEKGYEQDASILSRTIYEIVLQACFMAQNPEERVRLWKNHHAILRYRKYLKLKEAGDQKTVKAIESREPEFTKLKTFYDEHKQEYSRKDNWWGDTIKWLSQQFGDGISLWYNTVYPMESDLVHSGATAINQYISKDEECLTVDCYPTSQISAKVPVNATMYFLDVMKPVVEAFNLDPEIEEDVKDAYSNFEKLRGILFSSK